MKYLTTTALLALGFATLPGADAATLFTETFAGATPGGGPSAGGAYISTIPGAQFTVTSYNVDVIGVLNGTNFSCAQNPTGNCLDLVGNEGGGSIQSAPTFSLVASGVYTLTFDAILQGYSGSTPTTTFDVSLGSQTQTESADGDGASYTLTFTPSANLNGAELTFTSLTSPDGVHGAVLSDIVLTATQAASSAAPEPASFLLLGTGLAGFLALAARRRKSLAQG